MAAQETGGRPPKWLSTHPPSAERIANLQRLAPSLMSTYEQAKANAAVGGAPAVIKPAAATPVTKPAPAPTATPAQKSTEQQELDKFLGRK
jgi:predicted Zn-dependent protease